MQLPDKDNEFDDLIRAAAENYHITGANPDWKQMKGLLDTHMPARKGPRRRIYILLILLLFLLGGAYLYFSTLNFKAKKQVNVEHLSTDPAGKNPSKGVNPAMDHATVTDSQINNNSLSQNKEKILKQNGTMANRSSRLENKTAGNIKINIYQGEIGETDEPVKTAGEEAPAAKNKSVNAANEPVPGISQQNENSRADINKNLPEKPVSPLVIIAENKINPETGDTTGIKKKKTAEKTKHPFEFSLLYAPELTTIGFSNVDEPGSNYGLLVGYPVSKNLIIQTGVIRSRKNYIANGKDFELDYTMPPNHKLTRVEGYCTMYEIPLNIKSHISRGKKLNFFYTAGISTYIMTREFYTYTIATNNGSYDKDVKYSSQKNYWLSLVTAGIGIEKKITNTLNISAAPFIKIPLKGMGEGKLKLTGTGINFLLTYKPSFSKK